jgi:hypothetical protein
VWSKEHILSLGLSDAVTRDMIAHLPQSATTASPDESGNSANTGPRRRLHITPQTSVVGPTNPATVDTLQDIEPAVITNRFNNIDRTTTAFIQLDSSSTPHNYWTSTTDFVNFVGSPSGQQLPAVPSTTRSGDPMLSENPYVGAGLFAKRTYCSGVAYTLDQNGRASYSTLDVWYNDDPGTMPWVLMAPLDQSSGTYFYDKPSVATSWNTGTLGWTYVASAVADQNSMSGLHYIQLYRQIDQYGFSLINRQFSGTLLTSPIVVPSSVNANIYLLWVDPFNTMIQIARSFNYGNTFATPVTLTPSAHLLRSDFNETINQSMSLRQLKSERRFLLSIVS